MIYMQKPRTIQRTRLASAHISVRYFLLNSFLIPNRRRFEVNPKVKINRKAQKLKLQRFGVAVHINRREKRPKLSVKRNGHS